MSKFRLLLTTLLLLTVLVGGYLWLENQGLDLSPQTDLETFSQDGITWYKDKLHTFNMAVFDKPLFFDFTANSTQSVREQSETNSYVLAVNGSYFRGNVLQAEHAGLLQLDGRLIEGLVQDGQKQVTHVIAYDLQTNNIHFVPTSTIDLSQYPAAKYDLVQTGPLVIDRNQIQTQYINSSLNGKTRHLRSLLGYTSTGQKFLLITRTSIRLDELAEQLLQMPAFAGQEISAINLDGGSSTAMYAKTLQQFNFGETKRLPLIIGVR